MIINKEHKSEFNRLYAFYTSKQISKIENECKISNILKKNFWEFTNYIKQHLRPIYFSLFNSKDKILFNNLQNHTEKNIDFIDLDKIFSKANTFLVEFNSDNSNTIIYK